MGDVKGLWPVARAPFLAAILFEAITKFEQEFRAYRADGGRSAITNLIDRDALGTVEVLIPGFRELDDEASLKSLKGLVTVDDDVVLSKLTGMRMRGMGPPRYFAFTTEFLKYARKLETVSKDSQLIVEWYIRGLEPRRVSDRVMAHVVGAMSEGKWSLDRAVQKANEAIQREANARELLNLNRGFGNLAVGGAVPQGPAPARATSKPVELASSRGPSPGGSGSNGGRSGTTVSAHRGAGAMVCWNCRQQGHIARDCPTQRSSGGGGHRPVTRSMAPGMPTARTPPAAVRPVEVAPEEGEKDDITEAGEGAVIVSRVGICASSIIDVSPAAPQTSFRVSAEVGTIPTEALVDTGADVSLISQEFANKVLRAVGARVQKQHVVLRSVDGREFTSEARLELNVHLGTVAGSLVHHFLVLDKMKEDIILGLDLFQKYKLVLDVATRTVRSKDAPDLGLDDRVEYLYGQTGADPEEDSKLIEALLKKADQEIVDDLRPVVTKWIALFRPLGKEPCTLPAHQIELAEKGQKPIRQYCRKLSPRMKEALTKTIDQLLDLGIIEKSRSEWASPIVFVKKRSGEYRMCVDYRRLNAVSKRDSYPLPRMADCYDCLSGCLYYASLDMVSGYHQVLVQEKDRHLTAFTTPYGLFQFVRLPFGLCGAPATFQRGLNELLADLLLVVCIVYLDDILIHGRTKRQFVEHLSQVFARLAAAGIHLNASKTVLGVRKVSYLGQLVSREGRRVDPDRLSGLREMRVPQTIGELRAFLGFVSYYREFVAHLSETAAPLNLLLRKNTRFTWTKECMAAFTKLKGELMQAPLLAHPDFNLMFTLETDASTHGIGAVLVQNGDTRRTICFISRSLTDQEKKWSTTEIEALAVVWAVDRLASYLIDRTFELITDHRNLLSMHRSKNPRVQRWGILLSEFSFVIKHRSGRDHVIADSLSRMPREGPEVVGVRAVVMELQWQDGDWIRERVGFYQRQADSTACEAWKQNPDMRLQEGLWWRRRSGVWALFVPATADEVKRVAMAYAHSHELSGHVGRKQTLANLRGRLDWIGQDKDVARHIQACPRCVKEKSKAQVQGELLTTLATEPWESVHADFVGPLNESDRGNSYLLVVVDRFSRWVELIPTADMKATTAADMLYERILCREGIPRRLVTDGGPQFISDIMKTLCMRLGVVKHVTTPYHHAANGAVERANQTALKVLRGIAEDHGNWDAYVPAVQHVMNTAVSEATGYSPFEILRGRKPTILLDVLLDVMPETERDCPYMEELQTRMKEVAEQVSKFQDLEVDKAQKAYVKRRKKVVEFKTGDLVLVHDAVRAYKLAYKWRGPFQVVRRMNAVIYELREVMAQGGPVQYVHIDRLMPFDSSMLNETEIIRETLPRGEYVVEEILGHDYKHGQLRLRFKWAGYPLEDATWEYASNNVNNSLVQEYCTGRGLPLGG